MVILFLLALFAFPQQSSKVVLNTGVPEAEFYLDATYVAATDKNGTLTMEDFPAGTFKFTIKKQGYKTFDGSFSIREGEAKLLQPVLEKLEVPKKAKEQTPEGPRRLKPPAEKSSTADVILPVVEETPPTPAPEPPSSQSAGTEAVKQIPQQKPEDSALLPVLFFLIAAVLIIVGSWIWKRKRKPIPFPGAIIDIEDPKTTGNGSNRPEPPFIEELKRREEQLKAGFVGNRSPHIDPKSMKEKEVVIVLPKDAYRYEDDK